MKIIFMAIIRQFCLYWLTQRVTNRFQTFEKLKTDKSAGTLICPPVVIFKGLWSDSLMLPSGESWKTRETMIFGTQWRGPWSISVHIILFLIGSASIHGRRVDPAANFEQVLNLIAIKLLLPCLNLFKLIIRRCKLYVTRLSHASSRHQSVQIRGSASRDEIFYQFLLMNTWSSGSQAIKVDANQTWIGI